MSTRPSRIVCLTAETTETLYLLGEQRRIVAISGFTARPAQARREKRRVTAVGGARLARILELEPDLVLGVDRHAPVLDALARRGVAVHAFAQGSVANIVEMVRALGAMIGCEERAADLASRLEWRVEGLRVTSCEEPRPRVYFEEWDDPIVSAGPWVSELIEIAGAQDCFADLGRLLHASQRTVADSREVARRAPDIIIGSWCGRKFRPEHIARRPGWSDIPAVMSGELHEIKSWLILQPGPVALTDGLDALRAIVARWRSTNSVSPLRAAAGRSYVNLDRAVH